MSDSFAYWQNAMSGRFGPIHENDPQPGFYRTKPRAGERVLPVAIWKDGTGVHALRDGFPVDPCTVWTWCCMHPVPYETYAAVAERGQPWPEDIAVPGIGHNGGPAVVDDQASDASRAVSLTGRHPAETLGLKISVLWDAARCWLAGIGTVSTQVDADRAANYATSFSLLEKEAEETRSAEKKPVLEQGRAIDARWKPVVGAAEDAKKAMKKVLEPFLVAEKKRLAEAEDGPADFFLARRRRPALPVGAWRCAGQSGSPSPTAMPSSRTIVGMPASTTTRPFRRRCYVSPRSISPPANACLAPFSSRTRSRPETLAPLAPDHVPKSIAITIEGRSLASPQGRFARPQRDGLPQHRPENLRHGGRA